jgi:hypothetical protein
MISALDSTSLALLTSAMYQYLITDMNSPFDRLFVNRCVCTSLRSQSLGLTMAAQGI